MPKDGSGNRVRVTNRALEGKRFSTVRLPSQNEVTPSKTLIHDVSNTAVFDPIPHDPMFNIVEHSHYWPPPSLEDIMKLAAKKRERDEIGDDVAQTVQKLVSGSDGMDLYDRREDDAQAKKVLKEKKKHGELNHPRGKVAKNKKVALADSDED